MHPKPGYKVKISPQAVRKPPLDVTTGLPAGYRPGGITRAAGPPRDQPSRYGGVAGGTTL